MSFPFSLLLLYYNFGCYINALITAPALTNASYFLPAGYWRVSLHLFPTNRVPQHTNMSSWGKRKSLLFPTTGLLNTNLLVGEKVNVFFSPNNWVAQHKCSYFPLWEEKKMFLFTTTGWLNTNMLISLYRGKCSFVPTTVWFNTNVLISRYGRK